MRATTYNIASSKKFWANSISEQEQEAFLGDWPKTQRLSQYFKLIKAGEKNGHGYGSKISLALKPARKTYSEKPAQRSQNN